MPPRSASLLTLVATLTACAPHTGIYTPDCIAYAGDRIELGDGRFVWDKFTDQVKISEEGERIDPYPDFPVQGRYLLDDNKLTFIAETDVTLPELHLVDRDDRQYLLTSAQYETWESTGDFPSCPLILGGRE